MAFSATLAALVLVLSVGATVVAYVRWEDRGGPSHFRWVAWVVPAGLISTFFGGYYAYEKVKLT